MLDEIGSTGFSQMARSLKRKSPLPASVKTGIKETKMAALNMAQVYDLADSQPDTPEEVAAQQAFRSKCASPVTIKRNVLTVEFTDGSKIEVEETFTTTRHATVTPPA